jgi:uncharacterized protein (TIGR03067 family)
MHRFLLLTVALVLGFAPAPMPRSRRPAEPEPLPGLWEGSARTRGGQLVEDRKRMLITPQRMICDPGPEAREYALRIDRSREPATYRIDGVAGGRVEGRRFWGVLRLEKDVLTLTYSSTGDPMPTGFDGDRRGDFVEVYRRVKR